MIEPYEGAMWRDGIRDDEHMVEVTKDDGYYCGKCDICGKELEDDDVGFFVSPDISDIIDCAFAECFTVVGNHLVCDECENKIYKGEINIEIKVKDNKGKTDNGTEG